MSEDDFGDIFGDDVVVGGPTGVYNLSDLASVDLGDFEGSLPHLHASDVDAVEAETTPAGAAAAAAAAAPTLSTQGSPALRGTAPPGKIGKGKKRARQDVVRVVKNYTNLELEELGLMPIGVVGDSYDLGDLLPRNEAGAAAAPAGAAAAAPAGAAAAAPAGGFINFTSFVIGVLRMGEDVRNSTTFNNQTVFQPPAIPALQQFIRECKERFFSSENLGLFQNHLPGDFIIKVAKKKLGPEWGHLITLFQPGYANDNALFGLCCVMPFSTGGTSIKKPKFYGAGLIEPGVNPAEEWWGYQVAKPASDVRGFGDFVTFEANLDKIAAHVVRFCDMSLAEITVRLYHSMRDISKCLLFSMWNILTELEKSSLPPGDKGRIKKIFEGLQTLYGTATREFTQGRQLFDRKSAKEQKADMKKINPNLTFVRFYT